MMKKTTLQMTLAVTVAGSMIGGSALAQLASNYRPVSLNYVNLADGAEVSSHPVQSTPLSLTPSAVAGQAVRVDLDHVINSKLSGIGGAFNEQGGAAFMSLDATQREQLASALFNAKDGMGFSQCRTAVGSSDFGLGAYSYSETAEDFEQKYFSVARDEKSVIPFINAAQQQNPDLKIFASPWSPPGWMKEYGGMDAGGVRKEVGPEKKIAWVNNGQNYLRDEVKVYQAYALYFVKYIQAYARLGVKIERLAIQNETDMNTKYPSCDMSPEQMAKLTFDYIKPAFKKAGVTTELWAGTFRGKRNDAKAFTELDGADRIDGIAMQYAAPRQVAAICKAGFPVLHTEGNCFNSQNSMKQARTRFREAAGWLNAGAENYCYWNMVLNEESKSGWGWKQNSMLKIDRQSKVITYNSDYAPMALLSSFIRPGDQSVASTGPGTTLAVCNDQQVVVFFQNDKKVAATQSIDVAGQNYAVELPAQSLCAVVFEAGD